MAETVTLPGAGAVEKLFEDMGEVTVEIDLTLNPWAVLKTCAKTATADALYVDSGLSIILALATGMAPTNVSMKPRLLKELTYDHEIKGELPTVREIGSDAFVWMLATELQKVMNGKQSKVLSKERGCLFYVAGLAANVRWYTSDRSEWGVGIWRQIHSVGRAGDVVFTCN